MPYKDPKRQLEYQRQWMAKRRKEWIEKNGPCVLCGATTDLEIDHLEPSKKLTHRVWSWSEEKRSKELAKCRVLCRNCHKVRSNEQLRRRTKHGTRTMYENYRCRCEPCRAAKRAHNAKRYATVVK